PPAVGRARALIRPPADDRLHAEVVVGLPKLGRRGRVAEANRGVERALRLLVDGDAAALVLVEIVGLFARVQFLALGRARLCVELLQALVSLPLAGLLLC